MNNNIACLIAAAFIGASIYTMTTCKDCPPFSDYTGSLLTPQKALYDKIKKERAQLHMKGLIFGVILALVYLYFNKNTLNPLKHSCIFTAIVGATQFFTYQLTPKSDYMVPYLLTINQRIQWLKVYKEMQHKYYMGMILGMVGYFILSYYYLC